MSRTITAQPLTAEAFAPYGEVLEAAGAPDYMINAGLCGRYHDRARPETDAEGKVTLSIGRSDAVSLPLSLKMMERHPDGSQAFVPMNGTRFLVIVAADENGAPGKPEAFLTDGAQGIQYKRNCWHGVLAPLSGPADFLIVDRIGPGANLEEHHLPEPYTIVAG
ncbi:MAG: ureidoglycolate lyase [Nisaea sp.]|jgi:ureidoglycolate lyase|uniref:ureidoglycolate lyase n=1 Tax=Nisaea sp. TaxID=2024842 RepID=UPI001B2D70D4|nr:ureidoglycolate lyase [Nisaea sp.]MBO6562302.1 ureidoglycolate lyase [Nisaea sp.]